MLGLKPIATRRRRGLRHCPGYLLHEGKHLKSHPPNSSVVLLWFGLDHSNCSKQAQNVTRGSLSMGRSGVRELQVWEGL